jgi:outer membrane receptor protein involved in Fe transport
MRGTMKISNGGVSAVIAALLSMNGSSAVAQDPAAAPATGELAEIIVTAQKRSQDIKDVPLSISVLSGESLQVDHVESYEDITRTMPGVSFLSGGGPGLDNISIRGISSTSGAATVGIYLDEVSITVKNNLYSGAVEPKLFDIDHVEVLRGPQGTLYGSSSMGGTIRMIFNAPELTQLDGFASADVSHTAHGGTNDEVTGVLNLPLQSGVAALRLAVDDTTDSGYIDNYSTAGELIRAGVNSDHTLAARISLLLKPTDALSITPAIYYMRMNTDDTSVFYPSLGLYNQDKIVPEPIRTTFTVPSVTIALGLGWADLTSVTSYFDQQFDRTGDATFYNSEYLGFLIDSDPILGVKQVGSQIGALPGPEYSWSQTTQVTQEIRLASRPYTEGGIPLTWLAGAYFEDQKFDRVVNDYVTGFVKTFTSLFNYPPQDSTLFAGQSFPDDAVALAGLHNEDRQYAVFGELGYNFTQQLKGTVGLRYSHSTTQFRQEETGYFAGAAPPEFGSAATFNSTTPRVSLTYDPNTNVSLYASIAEGFRLGGAALFVPSDICAADLATLGLKSAPTSYDSDSLWTYEAGAKGRLLGNRLTFSGAVYYTHWNNIQQTINLPTCGYTLTTNVGDAKVYGTELEVAGKPTPSWTLAVAGGTTHATLTSVISAVGAAPGDRILNTPEWTLTLNSDYVHKLSADTDLFARASYAWTGKSYGSFSVIDPDHVRPTYETLDASAGADWGTLRVALYGKNILNSTTIIQHPSLLFLEEAYTLRPRTLGLMVTKRF